MLVTAKSKKPVGLKKPAGSNDIIRLDSGFLILVIPIWKQESRNKNPESFHSTLPA
jgi:hypothetical protein